VVTEPMSASQILVGIVLTLGLAVACQIIAAKIRSPAIVLLLPVGFVAGALTAVINPDKLFGAAFSPLVSWAVSPRRGWAFHQEDDHCGNGTIDLAAVPESSLRRW
jgi:hypothetical protein